MNKYQEALIYFCNGCHHEYEEGNYGQCKRVEGRCGHYKSLKEACDKAEKYDEINRVYLNNEVMESADINAERLQQLYEDMQPFIDKATPFIGSIMNKYQEAINELYKQRAERYKVYQKHKDWSKEIKEYDKVGEALETLQELVDKTKTHTLEEVKKKGEAKMTDKEIQELQNRVYAISYSEFPLDTFFNDIRNVSDPRFNETAAYSDLKLIVDEIYDLREKSKKYGEKETPKRPKRKRLYYNCHNGECDKTFIHYCPICNFSSVEKNYANYCPNCGQKLDWSEENE